MERRVDEHWIPQRPGFIRAVVTRELEGSKIEWSHDSSWRFLPTVQCKMVGYRLHPVDLSVSKTLTLVGRNEPRDFLDVLHIHREILSLGAACWTAAGQDPGFTPLSLLELLRRRGSYRPEDFSRLHLTTPVDLPAMKKEWSAALDSAERFIRSRPPGEVGCLYYSRTEQFFIEPTGAADEDAVPHYGRPCGVWPSVVE